MKKYSTNGVLYSDEYFTEEIVDWLLQSPMQKVLVSKEEELPTHIELTEANVETAFASAWAEMSKDQEFVKTAQQHNYTADKGLSDFQAAVAAPVTSEIENWVSEALAVKYEVKFQDETFVHYLNGEQILAIPKSVDSAAVISSNAEAVMNAIFIVIDVMSVVAAAASINVSVKKDRIAKSLKGPLKGFFKKLLNPGSVKELKRLQEAGEKIVLIQKVLAWLRGSVNLKTVLMTFFESMSRWEKAIAVLQFLASVALLLATAGASFAAKVLQLGAAIAILIADTAAFILAVE